jgi:hypothetical protein
MTTYVIPPVDDKDAIVEQLSTLRIELAQAGNVKEFIIREFESTGPALIQVDYEVLYVLTQDPLQYFDEEMPIVIINFPGCLYPASWLRAATGLPQEPYEIFEKAMGKAGVTSSDPATFLGRASRGNPFGSSDDSADPSAASADTDAGANPVEES